LDYAFYADESAEICDNDEKFTATEVISEEIADTIKK
jgi:hypothetical protein